MASLAYRVCSTADTSISVLSHCIHYRESCTPACEVFDPIPHDFFFIMVQESNNCANFSLDDVCCDHPHIFKASDDFYKAGVSGRRWCKHWRPAGLVSKPHFHGSLWPCVLCLGSHSISRELYNVFLIFRQSVCLTVNDDSPHISTIFTRVHLYLYIYIYIYTYRFIFWVAELR